METARQVVDILSAIAYNMGVIVNNFDRGRYGRYPAFTSTIGKELAEDFKKKQPS